ncbi:3-phosphoshikimate 1-carboxyvinyltransferase [candidate division KSB1 bacterium]|nr:3-phosphoshikimate 1-carboxyvinyltransferase [candidate division KSB1 bacterium]MCH7753586.1 3-phosphoshikimate 1-carboxyvinyltransferase [candidate division KSB1 bacterium]MCH8953834.1 3-phosphoshikimate 1-carboxyvinyltransferase [candidate division KSB1 bacterium]
MKQHIYPARRLSGKIRLQGDKSISHRALMIGAIAEGTTEIANLNSGKDVQSTISCLLRLGVKIENENDRTIVHGRGLSGLAKPNGTLDVGNSGTTIRLLSGILAGQEFSTNITGDDSIQKRPMARIAQPLRKMGAQIDAVADDFAPLSIKGGKLTPIDYTLPVASAQVKSCLLLAGLYSEGVTKILEPAESRDHTERMLSFFEGRVEKNGSGISVKGPARLKGQNISVPGDLSSAAFFIAAAVLVKNSEIVLESIGINPTRTAFLDLLINMGANIEMSNSKEVNNEPVADIQVKSSALKGVTISGETIPALIDEIPILAILATQADGITKISDAQELRHKESDRLRTVALNLKKMCAHVEENIDGLTIKGPVQLKASELDSFHDHRIAMSFAVAGLIAPSKSVINNAECVDVSCPGFYQELARLSGA